MIKCDELMGARTHLYCTQARQKAKHLYIFVLQFYILATELLHLYNYQEETLCCVQYSKFSFLNEQNTKFSLSHFLDKIIIFPPENKYTLTISSFGFLKMRFKIALLKDRLWAIRSRCSLQKSYKSNCKEWHEWFSCFLRANRTFALLLKKTSDFLEKN